MIRLARPHQWIKNTLLGAALVFSQRLFDPRDVFLTAIAFVAFCALSSAGYVLLILSNGRTAIEGLLALAAGACEGSEAACPASEAGASINTL